MTIHKLYVDSPRCPKCNAETEFWFYHPDKNIDFYCCSCGAFAKIPHNEKFINRFRVAIW